jgi:hypothetical protein
LIFYILLLQYTRYIKLNSINIAIDIISVIIMYITTIQMIGNVIKIFIIEALKATAFTRIKLKYDIS